MTVLCVHVSNRLLRDQCVRAYLRTEPTVNALAHGTFRAAYKEVLPQKYFKQHNAAAMNSVIGNELRVKNETIRHLLNKLDEKDEVISEKDEIIHRLMNKLDEKDDCLKQTITKLLEGKDVRLEEKDIQIRELMGKAKIRE